MCHGNTELRGFASFVPQVGGQRKTYGVQRTAYSVQLLLQLFRAFQRQRSAKKPRPHVAVHPHRRQPGVAERVPVPCRRALAVSYTHLTLPTNREV